MNAPDGPGDRQARAADPAASVWVSANAGSGKTKVLIDRVSRLLLGGVAPQAILCLTYTRAAAAEMQVRLFARLGAWAMLPDDRLSQEVAALGGGVPDLGRARRLFAQAIEAPGGLRIQTIHGFCAAILRRFPLEAGVSPGFRELEDRAADLLREAVLDDLAARDPGGAFSALAGAFPGGDPGALARQVAALRDGFAAVPDDAALARRLGLGPAETAAGLRAAVLRSGDAGLVAEAAAVLAAGSPNDLRAAAKLRAVEFEAPGLAPLRALEGAVLSGEAAAAPFAPKGCRIATVETRARLGSLGAALDDLAQRVCDARPRRIALDALARAQAVHGFARAYLPAWDAARAARGALDFDDLIRGARRLLADPAVAPWVLWRLDGAIDHILVDEAQDTAPAQWEIVGALAAEFTAGGGARPQSPRSLFVVGDRKQSIYSFQGADLAAFDRRQAQFRAAFARFLLLARQPFAYRWNEIVMSELIVALACRLLAVAFARRGRH